jgi:glycosyltransferase involved in cell wall biosynthesis
VSPRLSLVIPAHNEATRLSDGFERVAPVLHELGLDNVEVVIVDDGSDDDTATVASRLYREVTHLIVRHETNQGKGAAVRLGLGLVTGQFVLVTDADMAIDPHHITAMLRDLGEHDVALGSRAINNAIVYDSRLRTVAGAAFNWTVRRAIDTDLRDTQCGFKAYRSGVARVLSILGLVDGFAFDAEFIYLANVLGVSVGVVPVTWDDVSGSSVRMGRDSWRMLRDIRAVPKGDYRVPAIVVDAAVDIADVSTCAQLRPRSGSGPRARRERRDRLAPS